ncbi:MAG: hypothetical protein PHT69_15865 [Bacteroidales bacterium]|nr:hypothetical protein [Bacteroidales bacterium]
MKKYITFYLFILLVFGAAFLSSCTKEPYIEKHAGPWKINKVEKAWYNSTTSPNPDSLVVYESDTVGYFIFYNSNPKVVYVLATYPSNSFSQCSELEYEIHPNHNDILTIGFYNSSTQSNYTVYTVDKPNKKNQIWTTTYWFNSQLICETIWVEKQ